MPLYENSKLYCPTCQSRSAVKADYCHNCGASLNQQSGPSRPIIIGRGRGADYHIDCPQVSKHHASLTPQDKGHFLLRDLDSSNGVFVNSPRNQVKSALVGLEDTLFLASQKIQVAEIIEKCVNRTHTTHRRFHIGRGLGNDIRLKHIDISRRHAVLEQRPDNTWALEDIGSKNGTFVGLSRIAQAVIQESDVIRFGAYEIRGDELIAAASRVRKRRLGKTGFGQAGLLSRLGPGLKKLTHLQIAVLFLPLVALVLFSLSPWSTIREPGLDLADFSPGPANTLQPERHAADPSLDLTNPELSPRAMVPPASRIPDRTRPDINSQELVEMATVLVVTKSGYGSGFFIAPNLVLTNRHVSGQRNNTCLVANKALEKPVQAVVAATSADNDFAVLRLKTRTDIQPLKFSRRARKSDRVAAWGYPGLLVELDQKMIPEVVYSSGEISVVYDSPPIIAHTANISQGSSGGPLVNERGQVVGVNTLFLKDDPRNSFRQVFLAFKTGDILTFLHANNLPYELAE